MTRILMTKQGYEDLIKERDLIINSKIPHANSELAKAREQGDLSENSAYTAAKEEREMLSQRLDELNDLIKSVEIASPLLGVIGVGSIVTLENESGRSTYSIVGEFESNPLAKKISNKSPLGSILFGKKTGDTVSLKTPSGETKYKIVEIK